MRLILLFLFSFSAMGAFNPFPPGNPPADSISAKGNLLTRDGTGQAEFPACADTEIIEWDTTAAKGFKCVAKPVPIADTNAGTICAAGEYLDGDGTCNPLPSIAAANYGKTASCGDFQTTSLSFVDVTNLSITLTTTGNPVMVMVVPAEANTASQFTTAGVVGQAIILRDSTVISDNYFANADNTDEPKALDIVGAGTHVYKVQIKAVSSGTIRFQRYRLIAWEIK